ncbi:tRNA (N(6)-L-threonylcarbamoyladenosine(37)-C(2))-methylthiotransferase MtaB [soil metagenome]
MADGALPLRPSRSGVEVLTFGCRLNAYEGDAAHAAALADGLTDAVIVNTCAVTNEAVRQAKQAIRKARRERPGVRLVVTGCAAEIDPAAFASMPEVDQVLGNAFKSQKGAYALSPSSLRVRTGGLDTAPALGSATLQAPGTGRARAYVAVQNGCDHACTFCIIPTGRGPSRSTPAGEVVAEVRRLAQNGFAEVVLTGVDVTSWGADLPGRPTLGQLVGRILKLCPDLQRLRLSSVDAAELDPDLLRAFAEEERLAPYLHLSIQAGDDMVLKRMKRRHDRAQSLDLIAAVRRVRPDVAFGADLIAGFPTETDAQAENTLAFVEEAGLTHLHVFPYSPRPGTPAAKMPPVPGPVVRERARRLRDAGDKRLAIHLAAQVGRTIPVVLERPGLGRAGDFCEVALSGDEARRPGSLAAVRIQAHDGRRLIGAALAT